MPIVFSRQKELEYSISLIPCDNSAEDDVPQASDFTHDPCFMLNPDFKGICMIRYRKVGQKKVNHEVTIDITPQ